MARMLAHLVLASFLNRFALAANIVYVTDLSIYTLLVSLGAPR